MHQLQCSGTMSHHVHSIPCVMSTLTCNFLTFVHSSATSTDACVTSKQRRVLTCRHVFGSRQLRVYVAAHSMDTCLTACSSRVHVTVLLKQSTP
eukprot:8398-Heterococcus_DN1.PRE.6